MKLHINLRTQILQVLRRLSVSGSGGASSLGPFFKGGSQTQIHSKDLPNCQNGSFGPFVEELNSSSSLFLPTIHCFSNFHSKTAHPLTHI